MSISDFLKLLINVVGTFVSIIATLLNLLGMGLDWLLGKAQSVQEKQKDAQRREVTKPTPEPEMDKDTWGHVYFKMYISKVRPPCEEVTFRLMAMALKLFEYERPADPHEFAEIVSDSHVAFTKALPPNAFQRVTGLTVPLEPTQPLIEALYFPIFQRKEYFGRVRSLLDHDAKSEFATLARTPLVDIFKSQIPFSFEDKRDLGWWIVSPAGKGKTNLLLYQLLQDAKTPGSIIVLDSKGDLIDAVKELKLEKDVVILGPHERLALNPLQIGASSTHSVAFLEYLFSSLMDTKPTPLQSTLFRSVFLVLQKVPNASFATFRRFLVHGWKEFEDAIRQLDEEDQDFFFKGEYDSATYKDTKQQLLWRIRDLTTSIPILREMFKSPVTRINMTEWMDSQKIYLISNSKAELDDAGAEFFGRFFIAMIRAAADQRSKLKPAEKNPVRLYIDEAHVVLSRDEKLPGILDECRSQRIQVIAAHQRISQISNGNVLDALSNTGIRFANSDEDAPALATRLRTTADHLRSLPTGSFAAFVRDIGTATLAVPLVDQDALPKVSPEEWQKRLGQIERYCYSVQTQEILKDDDPIMEWGNN